MQHTEDKRKALLLHKFKLSNKNKIYFFFLRLRSDGSVLLIGMLK